MRKRSQDTEIERLREENHHLRSLLDKNERNSAFLSTTQRQIVDQSYELANTREELDQQVRLLNTVLSSIVDFVYTFDKEGRFTYVNQPVLDLFQRKLEDALGKNFFDLDFPQELAVRLHEQIEFVFQTGQKLRDETPYTGAAGTTGYYEYIFVPVFDEEGQVKMVAGSTRDLSNRLFQEEHVLQATMDELAAADSWDQFRALLELGICFAGVLTPEGTVVEANRSFFDACGYTREEVIGKKFWDCGWWNRSPQLRNKIREGVRQAGAGRLFQEETHYFLADGTERFVDLVLAPVTDEVGQVLFIAPTGMDITDRVHAEEALEELS